MDFVERWFGVSPDGGNGMYEAALLVALAVVVAVAVVALRRRRAY